MLWILSISYEIIDINEARLIAKLDSEIGLSNKKTPKNKNREGLLQTFDTKRSKAIIILELLLLAHSDNDFNSDESNHIK